MAFVFIDKPIDEVLESLKGSERLTMKAHSINPSEKVKQRLNEIRDKIRCIETYKEILSKRDEFDNFKYLKWKKPKQYTKRCKELVKDIKGIDIDKAGLFRVRITDQGKRKYIGSFDTPQDAIEVLDMYM